MPGRRYLPLKALGYKLLLFHLKELVGARKDLLHSALNGQELFGQWSI
jgi:hypothetical protein